MSAAEHLRQIKSFLRRRYRLGTLKPASYTVDRYHGKPTKIKVLRDGSWQVSYGAKSLGRGIGEKSLRSKMDSIEDKRLTKLSAN